MPTSGAPGVPLNSALALTSERVRERMVERLRANGIADARVLQALAGVPRHMFVDPGLATQAYEDAALPIGHQQTISKPSVVARMLELAGAGRTLDRVLEIGGGSGYAAAVMGRVAKQVIAIERHQELADLARARIERLGYANVEIRHGDGSKGCPEEAPFDAILAAASGSHVPDVLLAQLVIGGRLVMPIGEPHSVQSLVKVTRVGADDYEQEDLGPVRFVPLIGHHGWDAEKGS